MANYENEKLEFAVNIPISVTLDIEPSRAKLYEKTYKNEDGTDYVAKSYMIFAVGKKLFFAPEKLHNLLVAYKKGDTLTITKMQSPGQRAVNWKVDTGASILLPVTNDVVDIILRFEQKIESLRQLILTVLHDKNPKITLDQIPNEAKPETTKGDEFDKDLGF